MPDASESHVDEHHYSIESPGLIISKWLQDYNLAIIEELKLFLCTRADCLSSYTSKNVGPHLRDAHEDCQWSLDRKLQDAIAAVAEQHGVPSEYPNLTYAREPRSQIAGLRLSHGYGCPDCPVAGKKSYVKQHIRDLHQGSKSKVEEGIHYQCINKGSSKKGLRVTPARVDPALEEGPPDTDAAVAFAQKLFSDAHSVVEDRTRGPTNSRHISAWLMRAGFHKLTENRDPGPLRELVAMPEKDDPLFWVAQLVRDYMSQASDLIARTSHLSLQYLNSSSAHELNHTPFRHHHQQEETSTKYTVPIIRLIAGLLRPGPDAFQFPVDGRLERALRKLTVKKSKKALHRVFRKLWLREWPSAVQGDFNDPTTVFLGLYTLQESGDFLPANDVTPVITMLHRAIQLTALEELHRKSRAGCDEVEEVKALRTYFSSHQLTTFSDLVSLMKYATKIATATIGLPRSIFPNRRKGDFDVMQYLGNHISVKQLQSIYAWLEGQAIEILEKDIFLGLKLKVKYKILADNIPSTASGYSLLDDPNNPFKAHMNDLWNAILATPKLFNQFFKKTPAGGWEINRHRAKLWLQKLAELELYLLLGVEMRSGAPIRMAELVSTLLRNRNTRMRNVMGVGTHLALIRQYSKTSNNTQLDGLIPTGMDGFHQDIYLHKVTFARPVAVVFASVLWPDEPEIAMKYHEMAFMNFKEEFDASWVSKKMGRITERFLNWRMTVNPHRHIIISFAQRKCKGAIDARLEESMASALHSLQAGHSVATERRIYGLDKDSLSGVSEDMMTLYLDASTEHQKAFQIPPGGQGLPYHRATMASFVPSQARDSSASVGHASSLEIAAALDLLKTASERSQQMQEALLKEVCLLRGELASLKSSACIRGNEEPQDDLMDLCYSPMILSGEQITPVLETPLSPPSPIPPMSLPPPLSIPPMSLSPPDSIPPTPLPPSPSVPWVPTSLLPMGPSTPVSPLPPLSAIPDATGQFAEPQSVMERLRAVYSPATSWRSQEQMDAVKALLQADQDVIVALPTGLGKSLIAILPSQLEPGITVIIVPLTALLTDWKRRLSDLKVEFEHFEGAKNPELKGDCNLILVSCDVIRFAAWRKAIGQLQARRPVVRFVFDECHYYFTDYDFRRSVMHKPWNLRTSFPCQFVLLSATLPPSARAFLGREMALIGPQTISATSARPELHYRLSKLDNAVLAQDVLKIVKDCTRSLNWGPKDRYLIFVRSMAQGNSLISSGLDLEFYAAKSERQALMDNWTSGRKLGMVCTTALAAGNDYSNVRLTIHVGTPSDLIVFNQQSGRAGRDGKEAWCYLLYDKQPEAQGATAPLLGIPELTALINPKEKWPSGCFRFAQSRVIDGDGQHCLQLPSCYLRCEPCKQRERYAQRGEDLPMTSVSDSITTDIAYYPISPPEAFGALIEERFSPATEEARDRANRDAEEAEAKLSLYFGLLQSCEEHTCGACLWLGLDELHGPYDCPRLKGNIHFFQEFQMKIKYHGLPIGPCYTCHIFSCGTNLLHEEMKAGEITCKRRDIILPMLAAIWMDKETRKRVLGELGVNHQTLQGFIAWLSKAHDKHYTGSMAVLAICAEDRNKLSRL